MFEKADAVTLRLIDAKRSGKKTIEDVFKSKTKALDTFEKESRFYGLVGILGIFLVVQGIVSTGGYSGYGKGPEFGDFEAQRHWMEVTLNLPVKEWYFNTTDNDLSYWGLDYPPLTAYHSLFLGVVSNRINSSWVRLKESRGIETPQHKAFMRMTVIITMTAVYGPLLIMLLRLLSPKDYSFIQEQLTIALGVLYPGLIFVDNGHFQYNHMALGLFVAAVFAFHRQANLIGSCCFVLALNFKQMELYHSLPIFVYLLSRSLCRDKELAPGDRALVTLKNLGKVAGVVIVTFLVLWLPFLTEMAVARQVLNRLFPFGRGIFEDKVANFWCCLDVIYKYKKLYSVSVLAKVSACLVLLSSLPSLIVLLVKPSLKNLRISLTLSAMSFYLFSFQVHEKSILMVAIPAIFLIFDYFHAVAMFLDATSFSMYALCIKDGNPEVILLFVLFHMVIRITKPSSAAIGVLKTFQISISLAICGLQLFGEAPKQYPYLFDLFNAAFSCLVFVIFYFYLTYQLYVSNASQPVTQKKKKA